MDLVRRLLRKLKILPYPAPKPIQRMDLKEISISENLSFLVYWKVLEIGKGPAVILKAFGKEILKFDCFGKKDGHFHIAPHYEFRIYFTEETVPDQIQRTLTELRINALRYLAFQPEPQIRALRPNPIKYNSAIGEVEKQMTHFFQTVKEIQ